MQGLSPATVAEWTLEGSGGLDYYDGAVRAGGGAFLSGVSALINTDGKAVHVQCVATMPSQCSVPLGWVQHPDGDHPLRKQLLRRLVPRRPKSWVSLAARRPAGLVREHGRVQECLQC